VSNGLRVSSLPSVAALGDEFRKAGKDIVTASNRAGASTARVVAKEAKAQSSGPVKTRNFTKVTGDPHPFARRHGSPLLPAEILNKQTGLLARSWYIMRIAKADGEIIYVVRNTAPYAKFLQSGTENAFARPVDIAVELRTQDVFKTFFETEITAALSRRFKG